MALSVGLGFYIFIISALLVFAVFSNGLVIYCVVKFRKLRTVTNVLICNLAVSDILLSGFVMPQKLHDISHEEDFYEGNKSRMLKDILFVLRTSSNTVSVSLKVYETSGTIHAHKATIMMLFKRLMTH